MRPTSEELVKLHVSHLNIRCFSLMCSSSRAILSVSSWHLSHLNFVVTGVGEVGGRGGGGGGEGGGEEGGGVEGGRVTGGGGGWGWLGRGGGNR